MFYKIIVLIASPFFKLFYRIKTTGRANIPAHPFIVCCNHSSYVDPFLAAAGMTSKVCVRFVARSSLNRFKLLDWIFRKGRVIPIDRGNSDLRAIKVIIAAVKENECPFIFPQGTRMPGVEPAPDQAQAGLGLIASMTKVPVLPMAIVTKKRHPKLFRRTHVVIGKPISPEEYLNCNDNPTKKEIAAYCFTAVCDLFKE